MSDTKIGLIGLGAMGQAFAEVLVNDGYQVSAWNRTPGRCAELGLSHVASPAELMAASNVVISLLSDDEAILDVFGDGAVIGAAAPDSVHIGMSTIAPETAQHLAAKSGEANRHYISAPVMGRPPMVRARKQHFLVAGPSQAKQLAVPLLEKLSAVGVFDFGEAAPLANSAKLINNFMIAASIGTLSEALSLAGRVGIDAKKLHEQATSTIFGSVIWQLYGAQMLAGEFEGDGFKARLGLKDLRLMANLAQGSQQPSPMAAMLINQYETLLESGRGESDWTSLIETYRPPA